VIRQVAVFLLAALVAACDTRWVRADASPEQADRDDIECQRMASREASLRAGGFYGPGYYGPVGPYNRRIARPDPGFDAYGYRTRDEAGLHDLCMRSKGYQRQ
jgi:hypothetical protein